MSENKIYLIIYDNCESYEDHWSKTLCGCVDKIQAEKLVLELNFWIEVARRDLPKHYLNSEAYNMGTLTDKEVESYEAREKDYFNKLVPPYGFTTLLDAVDKFGDSRGYVKISKVELFTK